MRKGTILSVLTAAALLTACGSAADSPIPGVNAPGLFLLDNTPVM